MLVTDRLQKSRLTAWYTFRQYLEESPDPFLDVAKFFLRLPRVKFYTDPYDRERWPTAWELISENEYCEFNLILGMCYTLQLTERFKNSHATINVAIDTINKAVYYLLKIEDKVYGYADEEWIAVSKLPKSLKMQKIYPMKPLH
jgi:hypothetical protein